MSITIGNMLATVHKAYWSFDPGYLRTRHAIRTVITISITCLILWPTPVLIKFVVSFIATFSMQGIIANTRKDKLKTMLLSGTAMVVLFGLGHLVQPCQYCSEVFLIVTAFLTFFVRHYDNRYVIFPIFCWLAGFLGSILVIPSEFPKLLLLAYGFLGLFVAIVVYFYVLPEKREVIFKQNILKLFHLSSDILNTMLRSLRDNRCAVVVDRQRREATAKIHAVLKTSDDFVTYFVANESESVDKIRECYTFEYYFAKSVGMITESIYRILRHPDNIPDKATHYTKRILQGFIFILKSVQHDEGANKLILNKSTRLVAHSMDQLYKILDSHDLHSNADLIYLFNFYIGAKQLFENILALEVKTDV